jgi:hypothetical protein
MFITVLKKARHWSLSQVSLIQASIFTAYLYHIRLDILPSTLRAHEYPPPLNRLRISHLPTRATSTAHLIFLFDHLNNIW